MGCSEWRAYGERMNYWQYFEEQVRADILKLIESSCFCQKELGYEECQCVCYNEAVKKLKEICSP